MEIVCWPIVKLNRTTGDAEGKRRVHGHFLEAKRGPHIGRPSVLRTTGNAAKYSKLNSLDSQTLSLTSLPQPHYSQYAVVSQRSVISAQAINQRGCCGRLERGLVSEPYSDLWSHGILNQLEY